MLQGLNNGKASPNRRSQQGKRGKALRREPWISAFRSLATSAHGDQSKALRRLGAAPESGTEQLPCRKAEEAAVECGCRGIAAPTLLAPYNGWGMPCRSPCNVAAEKQEVAQSSVPRGWRSP